MIGYGETPPGTMTGLIQVHLGLTAWTLAQQLGVTPEAAYAALWATRPPASESMTAKGMVEWMERASKHLADLIQPKEIA